MAKGSVKLNGNGKVDAETFFKKVVPAFKAANKVDPKTGKPYVGVHTVYSGLNKAIAEYYGLDKEGVIAFTKGAVDAGLIKTYPAKGGFTLFLAAEAPQPKSKEKAEKKVSEKDKFIASVIAGL